MGEKSKAKKLRKQPPADFAPTNNIKKIIVELNSSCQVRLRNDTPKKLKPDGVLTITADNYTIIPTEVYEALRAKSQKVVQKQLQLQDAPCDPVLIEAAKRQIKHHIQTNAADFAATLQEEIKQLNASTNKK